MGVTGPRTFVAVAGRVAGRAAGARAEGSLREDSGRASESANAAACRVHIYMRAFIYPSTRSFDAEARSLFALKRYVMMMTFSVLFSV